MANSLTAQPQQRAEEPSPYRWTVDRLYRAIEAGVFEHPERIELIGGELIESMGQNPGHASLSDILTRLLRQQMEPNLTVREEKPLHISDDTEPVPDIMVVTGKPADYHNRHPSPSEVVLLLEVADTSSAYDTKDKAMLYAQAGIAEYWVVLLAVRRIIVHRLPSEIGYGSIAALSGSDALAPLGAPDAVFSAVQLIGG